MKQIIISSVVLFLVTMTFGFVVHGMLLHADYEATKLMRAPDDAEAHFGSMLIAHVLMSVGFTLIYRCGVNDKPWLGQGVRFGLLWAIAGTIPIYLIYHAVQPFPGSLVLKQCIYDGIAVILSGVVVAALNRK